MKSVRESLTVPEGFSTDTSAIMKLQEFLKKFKTFEGKNGIKFLLLLEEKTRGCFICLI